MKRAYSSPSRGVVIILGFIIFMAGLFWNSGQMPIWAAQGQPPIGTAPTREPPSNDDNNNDNNSDDDDDDDGDSSGPVIPGKPVEPGVPPIEGTVEPGPPGDGGPELADLSLKKTVNEPLPEVGEVITYTIVISNSGPANAVDVLVLDQLPVGVVFSDSIATRGHYSATTGLWDISLITVTEWLTLDVVSVVTDVGRIVNTAEITAASPGDPDSIPANGVPLEDDWDFTVITPTLATGDQPEEEPDASFSNQPTAPKPEPTEPPGEEELPEPQDNPPPPTTEPVTDEENSTDAEASVKAVPKPTEGFPMVWVYLLSGGVVLIAAGLWLVRR